MTRTLLTSLLLLTLSGAALASGGSAHADTLANVWPKLAFHAFNLLILIAFISWAAGGKIRDALADRSTEVRVELDSAQKMREEAQQQYADLQKRLEGLETQLVQMRADAEEAAAAEAKAIAARAERDAQLVQESAERSIRDEVARARTSLRREAVALAVDLAGERLKARITPADQTHLAAQFLKSVEDNANGVDHG